jgi:uncharacterized protein
MQFNPDISSRYSTSSNPRPDTGLLKDFILLAGIIALFTLFWPEQSGSTEPGGNLRIVFEATSGTPDAAETLLGRVESAHHNFGERAEISVIAYWDGIRMLRGEGNPLSDRLAKLADGGIDIIACQQSLKDAEMPSAELVPFARTVRSGAEEARRMEKQGWARVRDGESYVSPL